jgi:hypothetical protein
MAIIPRIGAAGLGVALVLTLGSWSLTAQEPGAGKPAEKSDAPTIKRTYDPARRVPDYFGQIGLTNEQREAIYKIRARHQQKLDELEKQVAAIHAQLLTECEAVLTDAQRQLLEHRRRAAAEGKKAPEPIKPAKDVSKSSK